jgi:2-polyprenyl-3-methyl-5-hydroxy-6-metoxy-1,4-benzoquinol methylase
VQQPGEVNHLDVAQAYRCRLVVGELQSYDGRQTERILDIGSGAGGLTADLARRFPAADIVGIEQSREGVERARIAVPRATFVQRDLLDDPDVEPRLSGWATAAVCSEILGHVDEPRRFLRGAAPYLAPGCRLVVTAPGGPISAFDRGLGHRRHFTLRTLSQVLADSGFRVVHAQRAGFPFFNLYRLTRGDSGAPRVIPVPDMLFRFNLDRSPFGWQIVAAATRD